MISLSHSFTTSRGSASVSEDGAYVAISNLETGFDIRALDTGNLIRSCEHDVGESWPTPVLFIHGGRAIVGGTTVGKVTIWDVFMGKLHTLPIPSTCFSSVPHTNDVGTYRMFHP